MRSRRRQKLRRKERKNEMGLFDRMKEVITVDLSEKLSYGSSIRKLSGEIKTNESEIRRLIHQTGSRCVEKHIHETDTEYEDLFAEIRSLRDRNQSLDRQIRELKEQQAMEEEKRRREREEQQLARQQEKHETAREASSEENGKICAKCKKSNDPDASFCIYCGSAFAGEADMENDTEENKNVL